MTTQYEDVSTLIDSLAQYAGISHRERLTDTFINNATANNHLRTVAQLIVDADTASPNEINTRFDSFINDAMSQADASLTTIAIVAFSNFTYRHREVVEALRIIQRAAHFEPLWSSPLRMMYYWRLGVLYQRLRLINEARAAINIACNLAIELQRRTDLAVFKTELSTIALEEGDPARALTGYEEAYHQFEAEHASSFASVTLIQIASTNHRLGNIQDAITIYKQALEQPTIRDDQRYSFSTKLNLALAYCAIEEYEHAAAIYTVLINERVPQSMLDLHGHAHIGMSQVFTAQHDWEKSLSFLYTAKSIFADAGHEQEQYDVAGNIADTLWKAQRHEEALTLLTDAFAQMETSARIEVALRLGQALEAMHVELGNHQQAYDILSRCTSLRKAIYSRESDRAIELDRVRIAMKTERDAIQQLEIERRKILHHVMPSHIADRLMNGEQHIAERLSFVGVLFADISGFTEFASTLESAHVLSSLENLFQAIDAIIIRNNCQRIKTIGDAYMASTGTETDQEPETILNLVNSAIEIVQLQNDLQHNLFTLRIGIHAGTAIAGVMKGLRLSYDMWGDTVNIASRMEVLSEPNRILVSSAVANIVRKSSTIPLIGPNTMNVRGRGTMDTYWIDTTSR